MVVHFINLIHDLIVAYTTTLTPTHNYVQVIINSELWIIVEVEERNIFIDEVENEMYALLGYYIKTTVN